ncbi:MAG TPA: acyl carrier protein [Angustibacter sp.]|nr:acyl carrier protein [Angustibacter sp.]
MSTETTASLSGETARTEATIRAVLAEHGHLGVDVDGVGAADDLYAAGLTSHASVNVMLALEDAFDVEFPDRMLRKSTFASVSAIAEAVDELKGQD